MGHLVSIITVVISITALVISLIGLTLGFRNWKRVTADQDKSEK